MTTTVTEPHTYRIPAENMADFERRLGRLVKRAIKLGVPSPSFELIETVEEEVPSSANDLWHEPGLTHTVHVVRVHGTSPKLEGWTVKAVVDMTTDPHLVHTIGEAEVPASLHHVDNTCEHCRLRRNRGKLMYLTHDEGAERIVGSTCLVDFVGGATPDGIAAWCELIADLDGVFGEYEEGLGLGRPNFKPVSAMVLTSAVMAQVGWRSKGKATFEGGMSTASIVVAILTGRFDESDERRSGVVLDMLADNIERHRAVAEEALAWAKSIDIDTERNDYLRNVAVVAGLDSWTDRHIGIGCSIVSAYLRKLDKESAEERKAAVKPSTFQGTIGKRETFGPLTVDAIRYFDSAYGLRSMVRLTDEEGNLFVWWASGEAKLANRDALAEGMTVKGKATVKDHGSYKGEAQTIINRCKFEEVS